VVDINQVLEVITIELVVVEAEVMLSLLMLIGGVILTNLQNKLKSKRRDEQGSRRRRAQIGGRKRSRQLKQSTKHPIQIRTILTHNMVTNHQKGRPEIRTMIRQVMIDLTLRRQEENMSWN